MFVTIFRVVTLYIILGAVARPPQDLMSHLSTICFPVTTNLITVL